jgi:hypothetical protein
MCWACTQQDLLELGLGRCRTQSGFGSGCTTGSNKFGNPKAPSANSILLGHTSRPKANGSCVRTHLAWVRYQDPSVMDHASESKVNGSCVRTHFTWVLSPDPILLGVASLLNSRVLS